MSPRLAVYGLLRQGERLAEFLAGARLLETTSLDGFDLFDLGPYPAAVRGAGSMVVEVYELPHASILDLLDDAEGVHEEPPLYRREEVTLFGGSVSIYVYARDLGGARRIHGGDWKRRAP